MSKFLTYEQRMTIQLFLRENKSFGDIAKELEKDRTTISKEVRKHALELKTGTSSYPHNACRHRDLCRLKDVCTDGSCTSKSRLKCSICNKCNDNCVAFMEEACVSRFKAPYVCNGCTQLSKCTLKKLFYDAAEAHMRFATSLSEARRGIFMNERELLRINELISPLIRNGQSIHQIYSTHMDELMCCEKTLYNYIDASLFDVRNIDLPRKVKYRPRYKKPEFKVDRVCRSNRTYEDYQKFMVENPEVSAVQMDSMIGTRGGKVLLTIHFVETSLMLAYIRDSNTSQSVINIWEVLYYNLGKSDFTKLFPVILTDNGSEFSNPKAIEYGSEKKDLLRTRVFYCDPSSPHQKGSIEVNHELIRRILPKGSSFDALTQKDVMLMMNHINSYKRKKLNNRTPYEAFSFYYGEELLRKLGCSPVPAGEIILKPRLLKK